MANVKCIDVSEWQGTIDWKKVKAAGYACAVLRAGFGRADTQKDKKFEDNYKNAKAAGVSLGVYWYSYAADKADAVREAKACLSVIKGKNLELPVFYDMEDSSMIKLGKSKLTECAKVFCDEIIKGGYQAGVYSNPNWFNNYLDYKELKKLYPIWLAQYYKEPQYDCDIWQYASDGKVSGISGNVDMNVIYNSGIITKNETTANTMNFETALLQVLLRQAYAQGLCNTFVQPIDNKKGKLTKAAIVECRTSLGYKNPDSNIDIEFIKALEQRIDVLRKGNEDNLKAQIADLTSKPVGDVNGDGKADISDVTALQKKLAGIDE